METLKCLAGATAVLLAGGYLAFAQDRGERQPPPPAGAETERRVPVESRTEVQVEGQVQRGVQVEGQVTTDRSASLQRPMNFHRAKQVMGSKVSIEGGLAIGTVDDIVFADDGMIEYLVVANEGKLVSVPWAAARFNFEQRMATVAITQEKFQQIPTFTADSWPRFSDPQYRVQTYSFYNVPAPARGNVTPREARKIDKAERKVDRAVDKANRRP